MARLIAQEPDVILLDEPFSALDSYLKWELESEMRQILTEVGKTTLFVSHNRDEVYRLSQRVGCIDCGKMEQACGVKEFFDNPKTKTAAVLSGCKNISSAKVIDSHHIMATDWNTTFEVRSEIPDNIDAVGIRAHYFKMQKNNCDNQIDIAQYNVIEDQFEWNVSFKPTLESSFIQWKISKEQWNGIDVPPILYVDSRDILLLKQ
jgi:molybdate transport system ATP-binding protein